MSRIGKQRQSTLIKLAIMEKHAFAMETLVREGPVEALSRLEILKKQLRYRIENLLEFLETQHVIPQEAAMGLSYRFGRLASTLEEGSASTSAAFSVQKEKIIGAIRDLGTYYDKHVELSVEDLEGNETDFFMVVTALEANLETMAQYIQWQGYGTPSFTAQSQELFLRAVGAVSTGIQVARDDPSLATEEFMSDLSADLAEVRRQFTMRDNPKKDSTTENKPERGG